MEDMARETVLGEKGWRQALSKEGKNSEGMLLWEWNSNRALRAEPYGICKNFTDSHEKFQMA